MEKLGITQQISVLFLVTDCASILQCSSDTLGKSTWKIPMEELSIDLMCPDLPFAENGVLKNRKLVKEIFYCALKNRKRLGRFVLRVLKNRKLVKEIFYCTLKNRKRLGT